jgi:hypothetical protein
MFVVGLISDPDWKPDGWDLPEEEPEPRGRRTWRIPLRPVLWLAVWWSLMAVVPVVSHAFGALAGFGVLMFALGLGLWRLERWCSRQYWLGLREHKS